VRWLLDTNIFIAALKQDSRVLERLETIHPEQLVLSPVVLGELELGVQKSRWVERNQQRLDELVAGLSLMALDARVARAYGLIRARLERAGQIIGANDLWIAAQAVAMEVTLVTDNVGEFERVEGLAIENWLAT
jgi:tRNA(fMet)-specific endonuclease VapC